MLVVELELLVFTVIRHWLAIENIIPESGASGVRIVGGIGKHVRITRASKQTSGGQTYKKR